MEIKLKREDFINQYPPSNFLNKKDLESLWEKEHFNLYVHIPYCYKKCEFCYYRSAPLEDNPVPEEYVEALLKEIEMLGDMPQIKSKTASSVYFGGGTPTMLSLEQIKRILDKIKNSFNLDKDYELCFEARPGDETSEEKLSLLMECGIKRISLGLQSLDDEILRANGRNHDTESFYKVFERARKAGIPSINTDIMSGMVNQTMESWLDTIEKLCRLKPENIAVYKLEIYLNNVLYKRLRNGEISLISDEQEAEYVKKGFKNIMEKGYIPVTNFSFASEMKYNHVHRKKLWEGEDMLGIGASSHSCYNGFLFQNELSTEKYINCVKNGSSPIIRAYKMSQREEMIQRIVFGIKGMVYNTDNFTEEFGVNPFDVFSLELMELGRKGFININNNIIETTYEGMIYADDIVRIFYFPHQREAYLSHFERRNYI